MSALQQKPHTASVATPGIDDLYAAHHVLLKRVAWMLCGDPHLAEDLVQETWLRAWRATDTLLEPAAARSWLITILKREHARLFERRRPELVELDGHASVLAHDPEPDKAVYLRQLLDGLTDGEREPLLLQVVEGTPVGEIAQRFGVSRNAMTIRLHRLKKQLRTMRMHDDPDHR